MFEEEVEYWVPIEGFEDYEVSSLGRVFNHHGRDMVLSPTQHGDLTVGLMRAHIQYRRSVKVLVARAFVPGEDNRFDTPIQLDGNRRNLRADNIVWRPRWFAWEYSHQFVDPADWYQVGPIFDVDNDIRYETILDAAITTGSLCKQIRMSLFNQSRVYPGGEVYTY